METKSKTHFRKVFKSDHLGSADLEEFIEEGKPLMFTIKEVIQHQIDPKTKGSGIVVAGRRISANIAYFTDAKIKPLVLNATNSRIVKNKTNSPFVEDWKGLVIELYIDRDVKMKGETVGGVRIKTDPITPITPKEIEVLKAKLITITSRGDLKELWNNNPKYKLSKEATKLVTDKGIELQD
jgi:hypothetical protein